jgi:hypothetical protein
MLRLVDLVRTDVSEKLSASFIRVTRIGELGRALAVTSNIPEDTILQLPALFPFLRIYLSIFLYIYCNYRFSSSASTLFSSCCITLAIHVVQLFIYSHTYYSKYHSLLLMGFSRYYIQFILDPTLASSHPRVGGLEYLHRIHVSRKRRQKGNLVSNETVRYGLQSCGTWTREWQRWRGPCRLVLSSKRAPHTKKTANVCR